MLRLIFSVVFSLLFASSTCLTNEEVLYDRLCRKETMPNTNLTEHLAKAVVKLYWKCESETKPLTPTAVLWNGNFSRDQLTTVIFVVFDESRRTMVDEMVSAYLCRNDTNIITIDLHNYLNALEVWEDRTFKKVGHVIGEGIANAGGLEYDKFHFVGIGFGAHVAASAARYYVKYVNKALNSKKAQIARITGLDPAGGPCFDANDGHVLNKNDAYVVDIITSNPGKYGMYAAHGHQNFYVGSLSNLPPGCATDRCAHNRAWTYYIESIFPDQMWNFKGKRCLNLNSIVDFRCDGADMIMGLDIDPTVEGIAFVNVYPKAPYGLESNDYTYRMNKHCGVCSTAS